MKAKGIVLLLPFLVACGAAGEGGMEDEKALRIETNEALAVSHLRSLVSAQIQAQSLLVIDADEDGIGEFAFMSELSGTRDPRGPGEGLEMPLLGGSFTSHSPDGRFEVHGYRFRSYLPGPSGEPVGDDPAVASPDVNADGAEEGWLCYAWPATYGESGRRTFVVGRSGAVHAADLPEVPSDLGPDAASALVDDEGFVRDYRAGWRKVD
jgi:hypothetical protein